MPEIIQVSIGKPEIIGTHRGRDVVSSIRKYAIAGAGVELLPDGILGDEQADRRVINGKRIHGGLLQAVYMFPAEHLESWATETGVSDTPGTFGENLTVTGLNENNVRIGDEFMWGDISLEVTKARRPCYKLPIHLGIDSIAHQMMQNGRTGWYVKVNNSGTVKTSSGLELVKTDFSAPTVAESFAAKVRIDPTVPDMD